jgi:MFS family permease
MSAAVFVLIAGEQLWSRYLPAYLIALGAPAIAVGLWGSSKDFLDAALQYPGGALGDRFGSQRALLVFTAVAGFGYLAYACPARGRLFVGWLLRGSGWRCLSWPALFSLVCESLAPGRRARGFMIQSVLRRVPIVFAPALGGLLVERLGMRGGLRVGFAVSCALALVTLLFQKRFYVPPAARPTSRRASLVAVWNRAPQALRRLLVADVLARAAESMADVFVVVYLLDRRVAPVRYGAWVGLQTAVSIVSYFPGAWLAERLGRRLTGHRHVSHVRRVRLPSEWRAGPPFAFAFVIGACVSWASRPASRSSWTARRRMRVARRSAPTTSRAACSITRARHRRLVVDARRSRPVRGGGGDRRDRCRVLRARVP